MIAAILLLAPLVAPSLATSHLSFMDIVKRQGDAFVPGTTPGCPDDWPICGTSGICYNPEIGQTCCPDGTYGCPSSSFCLTDGLCCPDGLDPETCAEEYGVSLPPTSTEEPTSVYTPPVIPSSSASSITISSTPIITPTSSLIPPASTPYVPSSSTPAPPVFTGAAVANGVTGAVGAVAAIVAGVIGNLV